MNTVELTNLYKKNFKSIFISKFCFKYSKCILSFVKVSYYLIVKRKKKNKINFFFIILLLIFGELPKIIKNNKKIKRIKKNEFLAFEYNLKFFNLFKFINFYLPISDIIDNLSYKFNNFEYRVTIKYFPIINEIDKVCLINTNLVEFIQDYKLVLRFIFLDTNWYFSECIIRSAYIPLVSANRFLN